MIPPSWLVDSSWRRVVALSVSQDESKWNPISVAELSGHLPEARRGSWDGFLKNMWGSSSKILVLSLYGDSTSIWGSVLNFTNWYYNDQWWLMMVNHCQILVLSDYYLITIWHFLTVLTWQSQSFGLCGNFEHRRHQRNGSVQVIGSRAAGDWCWTWRWIAMRVSGTADTWFPNATNRVWKGGHLLLATSKWYGVHPHSDSIREVKIWDASIALVIFGIAIPFLGVFCVHHHPLPKVPHGTSPFSEFDGPIIFNQWKWGPTAPFLSTDCSLISISAEDLWETWINPRIWWSFANPGLCPPGLGCDSCVKMVWSLGSFWHPLDVQLTPRWISMAPLASGAMQSSGSDLWLVQDARWKGSAQGSAPRVYDADWKERGSTHSMVPTCPQYVTGCAFNLCMGIQHVTGSPRDFLPSRWLALTNGAMRGNSESQRSSICVALSHTTWRVS